MLFSYFEKLITDFLSNTLLYEIYSLISNSLKRRHARSSLLLLTQQDQKLQQEQDQEQDQEQEQVPLSCEGKQSSSSTTTSSSSSVKKTAIVTGASAGIGKHVTMGLVARGYHVVMACRSKERAEAVVKEITSLIPNSSDSMEIILIDLASLESVRQFVEQFNNNNNNNNNNKNKDQDDIRPLHLLINNAGLGGGGAAGFTKDGYELLFQVNYLSHFLLSRLLLPCLLKTISSSCSSPLSHHNHSHNNNKSIIPRIIHVTSCLHNNVTIDYFNEILSMDEDDNTNENHQETSSSSSSSSSSSLFMKNITSPTYTDGDEGAYHRSKLYNVLLAEKLHRISQGSIVSSSLHPGLVSSEIWRNSPNTILWDIQKSFIMLLGKTSDQAALNIIEASCNRIYENTPYIEKSQYFVDGKPQKNMKSKLADNEKLIDWLWKISSKLVGLKE